MNRGAWWATVHGVTRVGQDLVTKQLPLNRCGVFFLICQNEVTDNINKGIRCRSRVSATEEKVPQPTSPQSQPTLQNIYRNIFKRTKKVSTREFEKSLRGLWTRTLLEQKVLYSTRKHPHKPSWEMSPLVTTQLGAGIITIETLYFKSWKELHLIFLLAGAVQTATLTVKCKGR